MSKTGGTQTCYRVFNYYCSSTARPIIQGSGSLATKDNMGSIKIKGNDSVTNTGLKVILLILRKTGNKIFRLETI